jgi:hypothetical protein
MKSLFFALLFATSVVAQTEPRLNQILQHPPNFGGPVVAKDFDKDGDLDIIFHHFTANIATIADGQGTLIENLGGRRFEVPRRTHHRTRFDGQSVIGNFVSDDRLDFLISELGSDVQSHGGYDVRPVAIQLAPPGGSEKRTPLAPFSQYEWMGVNLDADETTELLQLSYPDESSTSLQLLEKSPEGMFVPAGNTNFPETLDFGFDFPILDLDNDGDLDLVARDITEFFPVIIERTGPRSFSTNVHRPATDLFSPAWSDLDGDSLPDAYSFEGGNISWAINQGNFALDTTQQHNLGESFAIQRLHLVRDVPLAPALLTFSQVTGDNIALTTRRFGTWETVDQTTLIHPAGYGYGEATIDLIQDIDGDSHLDILVRYRLPNQNQRAIPRLAISWGTVGGFSPLEFIHDAAPAARQPLMGDFDQDGDVDLILGPDLHEFYHLYLNDGRGRFLQTTRIDEVAPPPGVPAGTRIAGIHSGDIDGDTKLDLIVDYELALSPTDYRTACGVAKGRGNGTFSPPSLPEGSFDIIIDSPCGVEELTDWDGDGDLDAVGDGAWRENIGGTITSGFRPLIGAAQTSDLLGNPTTLGQYSTGDLDGDGKMDISSATYRIVYEPPNGGIFGGLVPQEVIAAVGFGDGFGGIVEIAEFPAFTVGTDLLGNPLAGEISFADLNDDGHTDLAILEYKTTDLLGNPIASYSWRRNPGDGSRDLASWTVFPLPFHVFPSGEKFDFNGDGTREWVSIRGYLTPTPSGPLISPTYLLTGNVDLGNARQVGAADFDSDGDVDFLIGDGLLSLILVRNPLVEERSAITHYLIQNGVSPHLAGPTKDLDNDGRSNEMEFLEGTDPLNPDQPRQNPFDISLQTNGSAGALQFSTPYYSPLDDSEDLNLVYAIESSPDLINWDLVDQSKIELFISGGGRSFQYLPFENTEGKGFYRMNAQHLLDE